MQSYELTTCFGLWCYPPSGHSHTGHTEKFNFKSFEYKNVYSVCNHIYNLTYSTGMWDRLTVRWLNCQWNNQPVSQAAGHSFRRSVCLSISQWGGRSVSRSVCQSVSQWVSQSVMW